MLNARELPHLGTVWEGISTSRCEAGKTAALELVVTAVERAYNSLPLSESDLRQGFKAVKQEAIKVFRSVAMGDRMSNFESALKAEIRSEMRKFEAKNMEKSEVVCTNVLRKLYKEFIEMLDFHSAEELAQAWTEIKNEYDSKGRGPAKASIWNIHATDHILQTMKLLAYKMETKHRLDLFKVKSQLQQTSQELENVRRAVPADVEMVQKPPSCQECRMW